MTDFLRCFGEENSKPTGRLPLCSLLKLIDSWSIFTNMVNTPTRKQHSQGSALQIKTTGFLSEGFLLESSESRLIEKTFWQKGFR